MIKWINNKIRNWRITHGFFKIEELCIGAWCGCCGKWIEKELVEKEWPYSLCEDCGCGERK